MITWSSKYRYSQQPPLPNISSLDFLPILSLPIFPTMAQLVAHALNLTTEHLQLLLFSLRQGGFTRCMKSICMRMCIHIYIYYVYVVYINTQYMEYGLYTVYMHTYIYIINVYTNKLWIYFQPTVAMQPQLLSEAFEESRNSLKQVWRLELRTNEPQF